MPTIELPPVTDEHRRQAFALFKWPGVTFEQAMAVDLRRRLIEACAHGIRKREHQAQQRGTADPGHWSATCGDPHCMAAAHTVRRSPGQHLQAARTRANVGTTNQMRIAKIARTQRGRVGKLTDAQIAAILASPLGIQKEAQVHGVSPALIARMRRRNPARTAGTVWAGLGGRAGAQTP